MADLYDRLTATAESGVTKIPVHAFSCALREWSRGAVTKAQVVNAFNLDSNEQAQLDAIASTYQAKPNQAAKDDYLVKIHDVFVLSESGFYSKNKAKSELGF